MKDQNILLEEALRLLPAVQATQVEAAAGPDAHETWGKGDRIRLDFGRHLVGYLHIALGYRGSHPDAPVWLKISFAEMEQEFEEDAKSYEGWICSGWIQQEQVHVDVIPGEVALPRRYAFRYVQIEILDISSKFRITVEHTHATAVSSADEERLAAYSCADKMLERIDRVACSTLRDCMQRVFEDGPKRDRRLWMGDLRLQALANYETYRMNDMVKGCLYLFAALPMPGGQVGSCIFLEPEPEVDDTAMFDYSLLFVSALRDYYRATGDRQALADLWPTAARQVELAEEALDENGVVRDSRKPGWCFLDWTLQLNKQAGAQGVLLYALKHAVQIAGELGKETERARLAEKYGRYKKAARDFFWDADRRLFVSGKNRQISFASQVWMILGGAVEPSEGSALLERIEREPEAVGMVTPYLYHHYVQALILCGEKEKALRVIQSYWGGMVERGADTFWELYNPDNPGESPYGGTIVNSYCHAWSCAPAYFLRKYYHKGDPAQPGQKETEESLWNGKR